MRSGCCGGRTWREGNKKTEKGKTQTSLCVFFYLQTRKALVFVYSWVGDQRNTNELIGFCFFCFENAGILKANVLYDLCVFEGLRGWDREGGIDVDGGKPIRGPKIKRKHYVYSLFHEV